MRLIQLGCLSVCLLAACEPKIPKGVFACDLDDECPQDLVCRASAGEVQKYCNSAETGPRIDAAVRIDPGGLKPPSLGTFSSVGARPVRVGINVVDEGLQAEQRGCSATGAVCVTGGFQP